MTSLLGTLRGGLIASCQPVDGGPMDRPDIVAAMAQAAVAAGAVGLRIEGIENLRAVRRVVNVPIIGIVKSDSSDTPVRITVKKRDVEQLIAAGADIVAYDATDRPRHHNRDELLQAILGGGAVAMADCSTLTDGRQALAMGAAILGSTLSGYTGATARGAVGPDLDLIAAFRGLDCFVMAEGRCDTPQASAAAIRAGADAVTVGSSLTRLEVVTARFVTAISLASQACHLTGFAVDLGGTKTAAAHIVDGTVARRIQSPTDGDATPADQVRSIAQMLGTLGYQSGDPLGLCVTGRVDQSGHWHAVNRGTLSKISAVPLAQMVRDDIGAVTVLNDAAAATLAEHRLGAGQGHDTFAYITVSTGIGGGLVLNGHLHQSPNGMAGHIGFTSARNGTEICGSGRTGTIESLASGRAIARAASRAGHDGLEARAVFQAAHAGQAWAEAIVDTSAGAVADLCADLVATLGLTRIVIGGSIGLAPGYLERIKRHLSAMPALFEVDLEPAALGADSPLFGGLIAAQDAG